MFLSFYLSSNIFPGTTALEYAFIGGLSISCAMLVSPIATYISQKVSTRLVLNIGTTLETLSLITTSFVSKNWQLFLSQGACFGFGMGFCFIGSVGIVSQWFDRRRSLVNGIVASGVTVWSRGLTITCSNVVCFVVDSSISSFPPFLLSSC